VTGFSRTPRLELCHCGLAAGRRSPVFKPDEVHRPDFPPQGYQRGVPMGGDLTDAPEGAKPKFMVRALRDMDSANLDRIQIFKG
jgi:hypothetical protein